MGSSASWGLRRRNRRWLDICLVIGNRLPDLANVSDQSSGRDCGHRLFHRANGDLPDFLVFFVLSHHRRRVLHFGLTEHPDLGWLVL
jgi:hypothetical protein